MTTANKITLARIALIPVFVMLAVYYGRSVREGQPRDWMHFAAVAVFIVAAASDGLDGYIARRFNQRSKLGVVLDPIADKGLLLTAIITLSVANWKVEFEPWFPILVITRDAVILVGTGVLHYLVGHVQVKPSWMGKTATLCQMIAVAYVMLQIDLGPAINRVPMLLAGFFTFVSGVGYVMEGIRQLQQTGHGNAEKSA
jgi:CDP-diacylglycerol--glycerol-3-phosphate 3-phosphatidyltransferase